MFCAVTKPEPDAATDFGEISPVSTRRSLSRARSDGRARVAAVAGRRLAIGRVDGTAVVRATRCSAFCSSFGGPELSAVTAEASAPATPSVMARTAAPLVSSLTTRSVSLSTAHDLSRALRHGAPRHAGNRVGLRHVRSGPSGSDPRRWRFGTRKPWRLRNMFSTVVMTSHQGTDFQIRVDDVARRHAHSKSSYRRRKGGQCCVTAFRSRRTGLSVPASTAARRAVGLIATPGLRAA